MDDSKPKSNTPKEQREHYVNNREFSQAVVDYVKVVHAAKSAHKDIPNVTEYIGKCMLKIAEGLSRKPNFIRYTYREEMVMDAVENCIKAIMNYNVNAKTRSGVPNAFAYFTQICYYAFLRRIFKEKKQQDIKELYRKHAGIESFAHFDDMDGVTPSHTGGEGIIERIRNKTAAIHKFDDEVKSFGRKLKAENKTSKRRDSGSRFNSLECFFQGA